jgi:hypothetical protein
MKSPCEDSQCRGRSLNAGLAEVRPPGVPLFVELLQEHPVVTCPVCWLVCVFPSVQHLNGWESLAKYRVTLPANSHVEIGVRNEFATRLQRETKQRFACARGAACCDTVSCVEPRSASSQCTFLSQMNPLWHCTYLISALVSNCPSVRITLCVQLPSGPCVLHVPGRTDGRTHLPSFRACKPRCQWPKWAPEMCNSHFHTYSRNDGLWGTEQTCTHIRKNTWQT